MNLEVLSARSEQTTGLSLGPGEEQDGMPRGRCGPPRRKSRSSVAEPRGEDESGRKDPLGQKLKNAGQLSNPRERKLRQMGPMLAQLARELPLGGYSYEPKWDGFRCLAFVRDGRVELKSRHGRPFARYFPEIVEALARLPDCTLDGELLTITREGSDFGAL